MSQTKRVVFRPLVVDPNNITIDISNGELYLESNERGEFDLCYKNRTTGAIHRVASTGEEGFSGTDYTRKLLSAASAGDITAFYSDARLKDIKSRLQGALSKLKQIGAYYTAPNELMQTMCPNVPVEDDLTLLVQEVEKVLPVAIAPAQFDLDDEGNSISGQDYKTIKMMKLIPLLVEAVNELASEVEQLRR